MRNARLPHASGKKTSGQASGSASEARPNATTEASLPAVQRSGRTATRRSGPRFSTSSSVSAMPGSTVAKASTPPVQRTAREAGLIT